MGIKLTAPVGQFSNGNKRHDITIVQAALKNIHGGESRKPYYKGKVNGEIGGSFYSDIIRFLREVGVHDQLKDILKGGVRLDRMMRVITPRGLGLKALNERLSFKLRNMHALKGTSIIVNGDNRRFADDLRKLPLPRSLRNELIRLLKKIDIGFTPENVSLDDRGHFIVEFSSQDIEFINEDGKFEKKIPKAIIKLINDGSDFSWKAIISESFLKKRKLFFRTTKAFSSFASPWMPVNDADLKLLKVSRLKSEYLTRVLSSAMEVINRGALSSGKKPKISQRDKLTLRFAHSIFKVAKPNVAESLKRLLEKRLGKKFVRDSLNGDLSPLIKIYANADLAAIVGVELEIAVLLDENQNREFWMITPGVKAGLAGGGGFGFGAEEIYVPVSVLDGQGGLSLSGRFGVTNIEGKGKLNVLKLEEPGPEIENFRDLAKMSVAGQLIEEPEDVAKLREWEDLTKEAKEETEKAKNNKNNKKDKGDEKKKNLLSKLSVTHEVHGIQVTASAESIALKTESLEIEVSAKSAVAFRLSGFLGAELKKTYIFELDVLPENIEAFLIEFGKNVQIYNVFVSILSEIGVAFDELAESSRLEQELIRGVGKLTRPNSNSRDFFDRFNPFDEGSR